MRLGKTIATLTRDGQLILRRRMLGLEQSLVLAHGSCCGCGDCQTICPTGAVSITDPVVKEGRVLRKAVVNIDSDKCTYCGECAVICPTKSIFWRENQETVPSVIATGIVPALDEEIDIHVESCRIDCGLVCRQNCPVEAIEVVIEDDESGRPQIRNVSVERDACVYCQRCQPVCPYGLIRVKKSRTGLVILDREKCGSECRACADACPTGALHVEGRHVNLNEDFCIYCRACTRVCPVDDALEVKREMIHGRFAPSQLWAGMLEKLVSPAARLRHVQETAAMKRARAYRTRID